MNKLRKEVAKCDAKLVSLLAKRMNLSKNIALHKSKHNLEVLDLPQEKKVLAGSAKTGKKSGLSGTFVKKVFKEILAESRRVQKKFISSKKEK
jgi:chorismate mutase